MILTKTRSIAEYSQIRKYKRCGFTLIEVSIGLLLISAVILPALSAFIVSAKAQESIELSCLSALALEMVINEIKYDKNISAKLESGEFSKESVHKLQNLIDLPDGTGDFIFTVGLKREDEAIYFSSHPEKNLPTQTITLWEQKHFSYDLIAMDSQDKIYIPEEDEPYYIALYAPQAEIISISERAVYIDYFGAAPEINYTGSGIVICRKAEELKRHSIKACVYNTEGRLLNELWSLR